MGSQLLTSDSEAERLAIEIREMAKKSGADLIGIVSASVIDSYPPVWVGWTIREYTKKTCDVLPDAKSVVVMGYHVWDDMLELAVKKGQDWIYPGYLPLDTLTVTMISHLKRMGHKAVHARSIPHKRLAQLAGFGCYGKNSLIISPIFGPWIRLAAVLTNAEIEADKPFELDLCGNCEACLKACPVGALTPHKVDDHKCMLGVHLADNPEFEYQQIWRKYEPTFTKNAHLMCMECQKACKYGKSRR